MDPNLLRLSLNQLDSLISMHPRDQQADIWYLGAEAFENSDHPERWDRAIFCYQKVVDLSNDPETKQNALNNLSAAFIDRANLGLSAERDERDVRAAVAASEQVLKLAGPNNPNYQAFLSTYGETMFNLYAKTNSADDFQKGLDAIKRAIELADDNDGLRLEIWYGKLRQELYARFESTGRLEDLNQAFDVFGEGTLELVDPEFLFKFADLLQSRHLLGGSMRDLEKSRTILTGLLDAQSAEENHGALLNCLANNFRITASRSNSVVDCNKSIELLDRMLQWLAEHNKDTEENKSIYLCCKADGLLRRYFIGIQHEEPESSGPIPDADLDSAIQLYRDAMALHPAGNIASSLGDALLARYKRNSSTGLDEAIISFEQALELQTAQFHAGSLCSLADALQYRAKETSLESDYELAIETYEKSVGSVDSPVAIRINAAERGGNFIFHHDTPRAYRLFERAVDLLHLLSPRSLSTTDQQYNLSFFDGIVWSAASACLETTGDVYKAIRLTEVGRGVIANLILQTNSDTSVLEEEHEELAKKFLEIRDELKLISISSGDTARLPSLSAGKIRSLNEDFEELVTEIRGKKGFETFLDCPVEHELKEIARQGPIVIFSVSEFRSDALIITKDGLRSLPLPAIKYQDVFKFAGTFTEALRDQSVKRYAESGKKMKAVLAWLWDGAVSLVLEELGYNTTPQNEGEWPRVWWVRSGIFSLFPIHAAGHHDAEPRVSTIDRVISSYTPTIKSLVYARRAAPPLIQEEQSILVVGMPTTPGEKDLPFVKEEIEELIKIFPDTPSTTVRLNPNKNEIVQFIRDAEIFHFSGHGMTSTAEPSLSCLLLEDWKTSPLTIAAIEELETGNGKFAYLSACHSASSPNSGIQLLDESIHITSAFQLTGFRSIVGTLWYVYETPSKTVAKDLYSSMLDQSKVIHPERAAYYLHHAVRGLRDRLRKIPGVRRLAPDNPLVWAAYIHSGQ